NLEIIMIKNVSIHETPYYPNGAEEIIYPSSLGISHQRSILESSLSKPTEPNVTNQSLADRIKNLIARIWHQCTSIFESIHSFSIIHINTASQWFYDTFFACHPTNLDPFDLSGNKDEPWPGGIRQIFYGTQRYHNGSVDSGRVYSILDKLISAAPDGIHFNQASFKPDTPLEGGTCTAMSLEFLSLYLNRGSREDLLAQLTEKLSFSSQELRNRQMAFNMIEVNPELVSQKCLDVTPFDYTKNKIQAIANYHDLRIDYASQELDLSINENNDLFHQIMKNLPDGAFLIRVLKPAKNSKMEEYGHSLAYIQDGKTGILYDPNYGLRHIDPEKTKQVLYRLIKTNVVQEFGLSQLRFYRLKG
ncbi:MAG: hypothetical protein EB051_04150, partial [Chlamydiia bacterium]|nr:hypothetical protein [Chlamydiia bacterium]